MDPMTISAAFALAKQVPTILKWITGSEKAEEAAQQVVAIAETVTGMKSTQAVAEIQANPEALLAFRRAIADSEVDLDKAYLQDVQDARRVHGDHWMPALLTILILLINAGLTWALFNFEAPAANKEVLFLFAGQLLGALSTAVAYWLGSSRGSHVKTMLRDRV